MSILTSILTDAQLLESLATNPTAKKIESYIPTIIIVLATKQVTFEVDGYLITAKQNGAPASFTLSAAVLALENILAGKTGTFVCGVIELDIVKAPTPVPA